MPQLHRSFPPKPSFAPQRDAVRATAVAAVAAALALLAGASACGDADRAAPPADVQCVRVEVANLALTPDDACVVAHDPLAARLLPDLSFTPGLCFTTGEVPVSLVAADGATTDLRITAYSGIDGNPVAGASLAPFPVPLVDPSGVAHVYIAFTAASVIEVRQPDGAALGALVTRDAGWAELEPPRTLPSFVSERLSITGSSGDVLAGVVGEVLASGDEFSGLPARGSLCAPGFADRLRRLDAR
jgi:hypothetical protein